MLVLGYLVGPLRVPGWRGAVASLNREKAGLLLRQAQAIATASRVPTTFVQKYTPRAQLKPSGAPEPASGRGRPAAAGDRRGSVRKKRTFWPNSSAAWNMTRVPCSVSVRQNARNRIQWTGPSTAAKHDPPWRYAAFTVVEGNRTSTLLAAVMVLLAIGVIAFLVDERTALRRELEETRHEREELRARFGVNAPTTVDYIGAGGIVDGYISPKLQGMREIHRISVRRDFLERFDRVTGAKLGEHKYNRALLHQWMQSNAARFLVEHCHEMS